MIRTDTGYIRNINGIFVAIITIIVLLAVWQIRGILMLAIAAMMLTVFFSMPVRYFVRRGLNRGFAILLSLSAGIVLLIVLALLVFPTLFDQFTVLFTEIIPQGIQQLVDLWNSGEIFERVPFLESAVENFAIDNELINQVVSQISNALSRVGGSVIPLIGGVASMVLSTLIIIFLCMYLIAEPERYIEGVITLTPLWYRDRMREILSRIDTTIRAWLQVTGVSMIIVGVGTAVGLALLGIEQWAALGVLAGVLSFIPNFGPVAALVPSIAVAIIQAPNSVLIVIIIIYGVSFVQSQVVGPILTNESMNLAPVLILIGQIVFGIFFGFLGIMLAVPLTAIAVILVEEIYVKDILGDTAEEKPKSQQRDDDDIELEPETD